MILYDVLWQVMAGAYLSPRGELYPLYLISSAVIGPQAQSGISYVS